MTALASPVLVGRSSSHFTRIARIFAHELEVACEFQPVLDLTSVNRADYADNPTLRVPILRTEAGTWFGALNICRALARRSTRGLTVVWPEEMSLHVAANAQELTLQTMATEGVLIMAKVSGTNPDDRYLGKLRVALVGSMEWLEAHVDEALSSLPAKRDLSTLEVSLFCLITHLDFREILSTAPYPRLTAFATRFAERTSAQQTPYRFDV
jgi:glutathione S-transferase